MFEVFAFLLFLASIAVCFYYSYLAILEYGNGKKLTFPMWCIVIIVSMHLPVSITNFVGNALTFVNGVIL